MVLGIVDNEGAGRLVIRVNPADPSRACHACHYPSEDNRNGEEFRCRRCGHTDHADLNSPKNMLDRAGAAGGLAA